jgi:sugar phosphate isomerase/epimerase
MRNQSRRNFIKLSGLGLALGSVGNFAKPIIKKYSAGNANESKEKLTFGICSYSFRNYPLTQAIAMIKRVGIKRVSLKDVHLSLKSTKEELLKAAEEIKQAELVLYTVGVVYMTTEEEVYQAFEYAKTLDINMIVGVPEYQMLSVAEKKVKEYNIRLAIHNHGPNDKRYPGPGDVYDRIKNMDPRIGLCLDIGHAMRLGINPSIPAEQYFDRLFDCHIKDESKAAEDGSTVEMGRGVIDIPNFFRTLIRLNYKGTLSFEFEKDENDPLPGVAESVGYAKGVLSVI